MSDAAKPSPPRRSLLLAGLICLCLTAPASAVTFRVVDMTVSPGATFADVRIVIDPEGTPIDGFQFGIDVSGGPSITDIVTNDDWVDWVTLGSDEPLNLETATSVGTGYTIEVDISDDDFYRFTGFSPFYVVRASVTLPAPGVNGDSYSVFLTSDLGLPTGYMTGEVFSPVVNIVNGTFRVGELLRDFDVTGPADPLDGDNWSPTGALASVDRLFIRNDGAAEATTGSLAPRDLRVGDTAGDGTLTLDEVEVSIVENLEIAGREHRPDMTDGDVLTGTHVLSGSMTVTGNGSQEFEFLDGNIAEAPTAAGANITSTGDLSVGAMRVFHAHDDLELALVNDGNATFNNATADLTADITVTETASLVIGEDIEFTKIQGHPADASASITLVADGHFQTINDFFVGEDFEMAKVDTCGTQLQSGVRSLSSTVVILDVGRLILGEDLEVADGNLCGATNFSSSANLTVTDVTQVIIGEDLEIFSDHHDHTGPSATVDGVVQFNNVSSLFVRENIELASSRVDGDATSVLDVDATLDLTDVATLTAVDNLVLGDLDISAPPDPAAGTTLDGTATLTNGLATFGGVARIGTIHAGGLDIAGGTSTPGEQMSVSGSLNLTQASLLVPQVWLAVIEPGLTGFASGQIDLSGYLLTELLEVGEHGTVQLTVESDVPASASTVGMATQARIEAAEANLHGHITVDVTYSPPAGLYSYDLIVANAGALADLTATLEVGTLPQDFIVRSFGVVSDTNDVLRLVIEGPVLFADGFESGDTTAW